MSDLLIKLRQMMAEGRFFEAQIELDRELFNKSSSIDLLEIKIEILQNQKKTLPTSDLITIAESYLDSDVDKSKYYLSLIDQTEANRNYIKTQKLKVRLNSKSGEIHNLYAEIFDLNVFLCERRIPLIFAEVQNVIDLYFKEDFSLKLQKLSLLLMKNDVLEAEKTIKELILGSFEKSSTKGIFKKLLSISTVIDSQRIHGPLDLYSNLCSLYVNGILEKKDYKRLVEILIYFDDFKLQVLALATLHKIGVLDVAHEYAYEVKNNANYDFVYLDKYFPSLKQYFHINKKATETKKEELKIDLALLDKVEEKFNFEKREEYTEDLDEGHNLVTTVKYNNLSFLQLLEISTSLIQAEYFSSSLKILDYAISNIKDHQDELKVNYLKVICLLKLNDLRGALDIVFRSLAIAESEDDVLSFLYCQAEIFYRLKKNEEAKTILKRIMQINANYRQVRKFYEKINAI